MGLSTYQIGRGRRDYIVNEVGKKYDYANGKKENLSPTHSIHKNQP